MEPFLTSLVASLAVGAVAASKDVASAAIKDAYAAIKSILVHRYSGLDFDALERDPKNPEVLADLTVATENSGALADQQITALVDAFKAALKEDEKITQEIGVELSDVKIGTASISDIIGFRRGVVVNNTTAEAITITNVRRS